MKVKQGDNEELLDYLTRFKSERDIVMRLFRKRLLDGYTENLPDFPRAGTDDEKKKAKEEETDKFTAVPFLRNANYDQYGELLLEYRKAYANSEERYPKTLSAMVDVMR